jgi:ATP-dependent Clp protease ATP-binding subunit ClpB
VQYGARPLKRALQRLVQDPLALKILDGEVRHGDHVIVEADLERSRMVFKVSERATPEHAGEPGRVGEAAPTKK